jgi:hypothetical protein
MHDLAYIPEEFRRFLDQRDGASQLTEALQQRFTPSDVCKNLADFEAWHHIGLYYFDQHERHFEPANIFLALYRHLLDGQKSLGQWFHKAIPLLWIAECYAKAGFHLLRKRYLMLALIEDAIRDSGIVKPGESGVYFRLVWRIGMRDSELRRYALESSQLHSKHPAETLFPEWALQQLDQDWMTEVPSPAEASVYVINGAYVLSLLDALGSTSGKALEELAAYLLACMPGCHTSRRILTPSTDYDVVCSMEGFEV